jgi:hypothetical protein
MIGIGIGSREMMIVHRGFRVVPVVCLWFGNFE